MHTTESFSYYQDFSVRGVKKISQLKCFVIFSLIDCVNRFSFSCIWNTKYFFSETYFSVSLDTSWLVYSCSSSGIYKIQHKTYKKTKYKIQNTEKPPTNLAKSLPGVNLLGNFLNWPIFYNIRFFFLFIKLKILQSLGSLTFDIPDPQKNPIRGSEPKG